MSFDCNISMQLMRGNESFLNSNSRSKKGQSKKFALSSNFFHATGNSFQKNNKDSHSKMSLVIKSSHGENVNHVSSRELAGPRKCC